MPFLMTEEMETKQVLDADREIDWCFFGGASALKSAFSLCLR